MNWVWKLWPYMSLIVSKTSYFLLNLVGDVSIINRYTLNVNGFAAEIGEACSGIYSIFIFSALYIFAVILDWGKMNKFKVILLFVPAIIGAFFANILRVVLLMLVGGYISRELAPGLYHSYAGMIFFLIYFAIFWILFYDWMKSGRTLNEKNN